MSLYIPKVFNMEPENDGFGRWCSFSIGWFLGSILNFPGGYVWGPPGRLIQLGLQDMIAQNILGFTWTSLTSWFEASEVCFNLPNQNISKYIKIYIRMIFEDRVKDVKNIENKTAQLEQSTQLVSLRLKTKWQRHSCSLAGMGIRSILEEAKDGGNSFGSFSRLRKQPPSQVMLTSKDSTHEEILRSKRAVCWVLSFLSFPTAL